MKDPRRDEYRAECAAAARRGVMRLRWPGVHSLFISSLNDNVSERLLRDELSSCGSITFVKIPTLHGRSLGLARVDLQGGVSPDRFVKVFHGRELLGQRMNVVIDQDAKKFEEALQNMKFPKERETRKEVFQPSPKKRARVTDSPSYSPASPARPLSGSDGPSPSKPKRPPCSNGMLSPLRRDDNHPHSDNYRDARRPHQDRQIFHDHRSSYRDHESNPRTLRDYPRSFAKNGPRDYRARYQESRGRYDHQPSFSRTSRYPPNACPILRHEMSRDHPPHFHENKNKYDEHRWQVRGSTSHGSGYRDRNFSSLHRHEFNYNRNHLREADYRFASAPFHSHENFPRHDRPVSGPVWVDETRPAVTLERVPRRTTADLLLITFRSFRPINAINNGRGQWKMWFDNVWDRNKMADKGKVEFRDETLTVKKSSHVVGRKLISEETQTENWRRERFSRDFDKRSSGYGVEHPVRERPATEAPQYGGQKLSRADGNHKQERKGLHEEYQASTQRSNALPPNDGVRNHIQAKKGGFEKVHTNLHDPEEPEGESADRHDKKEWHRKIDTRCSHKDNFADRQRSDEHTQQNGCMEIERSHATNDTEPGPRESSHKGDALLSKGKRGEMHSRDVTMSDVGSTSGPTEKVGRTPRSEAHKEVQNGKVSESMFADVEKAPTPCRSTLESDKNAQNDRVSKSKVKAEKTSSPETPKKLTLEDFADLVAKHVYRTAKEAIAVRRTAIQKSFVVQSVVKFVKSSRERENRERAYARHAALAKQKPQGLATEKEGVPSSSVLQTAHRDLETFLRSAKPKPTKPPLPDRHSETPTRRRTKRSRFADSRPLDSDQEVKPGSSTQEDEGSKSPEGIRSTPLSKRRRLLLPSSPESPDPGHASPDGNRQNSVETVTSAELFQDKEHHQRDDECENKETKESSAPEDSILRTQKPNVRHSKGSSLKLSSPSMADGSIPHLVLSKPPPTSPDESGPVGSAFTTSEDSASQGPSKPTGVIKKTTSRKPKTGKQKKKTSRAHARQSKKQTENTTDEEHYAGVLLSLNGKTNASDGVIPQDEIEVFNSPDFVDFEKDSSDEDGREKEPPKEEKKENESVNKEETESDVPSESEVEPLERIGKCGRTDVYVRAEHVGQHRQRNVHARNSTSTQSSRESRQENRIYRKGVSHINPKNDIITFNHLKQRRKSVSFGQSRIHGMGLFAKENIDAGEFIIEYVGDLIRRVVADLREKKYARQGMGDSYLFRLSGDWVVDATRRGGIARFINHSCDPNVFAKIITVGGEPKIVFYSKCSIKEGEELTYDYKFDYEAEDQKIPCLCQAPSCRKYLN